MNILNIDIETFSSVDLKKSGLYRYVQSPDFEVLLFAYSLDGSGVKIIDLANKHTIPIEIIQAINNPAVTKHAFNAAFEWCCLSKHFGYKLDISQWRCTQFKSMYCGIAESLATTGTALGLEEDKKKLTTGAALIKTFCTPTKPSKANGERTRTLPHHEPEKWELFKQYCVQDVVTEMAVADKLKNFHIPPQEQRLWELNLAMNAKGVRIDKDLMSSALILSDMSTARLRDEACKLTGLNNPNSTKQLSEWLKEVMGEGVESLTKANVKEMLKACGGVDSELSRMLELRLEMAKTSVKKYQAINRSVCKDGRVRGLLQFYGASTGRYSGRLFQIHNLPKNYLSTLGFARELVKARNFEAIELIYGNVPDTLSQLVRTVIIPSEGCNFTVVDYASIEARVLAYVAGEKWALAVYRGDGRIYEQTAANMFKVPVETIVKGHENYKYRSYGKLAVLACGYGGSVGALQSMGAIEAGIPENELQGLVDKWRSANPNIVAFWYALQNKVLDCIKTGVSQRVRGIGISKVIDLGAKLCFLNLELPSGRKLYYAMPYLTVNKWGGDSIGFLGMNSTSRKWGREETYSGKLVENCVQAIARDCLVGALERLHDAGYDVDFHVHDEVVISTPKDKNCLKDIERIMCEEVSWARGLPLRAEGFITDYYRKDG